MLKTIKTLILFLFLASNVFSQKADTMWVEIHNQPLIANTIKKDFGVINVDDKAVFKFKLKNLNDKPLVIWHVSSSCGCTVPTWTEKPIKKDKQAIVKVKYDSSKTGVFEKSVFVYTNFHDKPIKLSIKGVVVKRKSDQNITKQSINFKGNMPQSH